MKALDMLRDIQASRIAGVSNPLLKWGLVDFNIAIKELEDLKDRSCDNCKHFKPSHKAYNYAVCEQIGNVTVPKTFGCNKWEPKQ